MLRFPASYPSASDIGIAMCGSLQNKELILSKTKSVLSHCSLLEDIILSQMGLPSSMCPA